MGYCYGLGNYGANFMGGFSWMIPLLFIGLIGLGIYFVTKTNNTRKNNDSLNILDHEYAKGNISRDEYLERKRDLQ